MFYFVCTITINLKYLHREKQENTKKPQNKFLVFVFEMNALNSSSLTSGVSVPCLVLSDLTSEDDEAVLLLGEAPVQTNLLIGAGERAEAGGAGGAGLPPPSVGGSPPQTEAPTKSS